MLNFKESDDFFLLTRHFSRENAEAIKLRFRVT